MEIKLRTNWRLAVPLLGIMSILGGCAGQMPKASLEEAWVSLKEEPMTTVMAETVDGKRLNDGRYFEVSAGNHTLGATLFVEGEGDSNGATCNASVTYKDFKAGKHYTLVESSLGQEYKVTLYNSADKPLAQSSDINCMAG
ncbi:DUF2057 domain-containing protein [Pseudomonas sp. LRP2-20]|uniref:PA0061/PA0062 family lipoprotein n=1 Tax=Pseudomonas sp. LRP2-20 TaxID=2944234 RepID=UPI002189F4BA|nr:hypothetical protein [Pseudomonas sp. LRP2-20]BDM22298.1 DUF2057 domain-containing protein [Pseudomonas sp. LRP2-20]